MNVNVYVNARQLHGALGNIYFLRKSIMALIIVIQIENLRD